MRKYVDMRRITFLGIGFFLWFCAVIARLFFWQVMQSKELTATANRQYERPVTDAAKRGSIKSGDGFLLVGNATRYQIIGKPNLFSGDRQLLAQKIVSTLEPPQDASQSQVLTWKLDLSKQIEQKMSDTSKKWVSLYKFATSQEYEKLFPQVDTSIAFEPVPSRYYPEGSMSGSLLGFLGVQANGSLVGYYGLEGAYDRELSPVFRKNILQTDAVGNPIRDDLVANHKSSDGRSLVLTVRRDILNIIQQKLIAGISMYEATSGDVVVMDPQSGKILASVSYPSYDPATYYQYPDSTYANSVISTGYEPGSTMKVLTVAAGIDAGVITPDTQCDICAGPIHIGSSTIRTWDEKYHPNTTIQEGLTHSDNTAMVFVGKRLGKEKQYEYLKKFGLGEKTGVDLQGEFVPSLYPYSSFGDLDSATATFGQGVAVTPLQLLTAVNAIANGGILYRPYVVEKILGDGQEYSIAPQARRQVISTASARIVASMMQTAAQNGDARWTLPKQYPIAGKTGTAQIAINGKYDESKTIASFVGFSPVENPKFSMQVRLVEPKTSIWGSETAAPLWFSIAKDLFVLYGIEQLE